MYETRDEKATRKREREREMFEFGSADPARIRRTHRPKDGGNDVTGVVIHMAKSGVDPQSCCARDRELLSIVGGRRHLGQ